MTDDVLRLDGRAAVVTGASRGIGRAIAVRLAQRGADVVLVGRQRERLLEVAGEIGQLGVRAHVRVADLRQRGGAEQLAREIAEIGAVDALVNNAGIQQWAFPFLEAHDDYWRDVIEVDLIAPYILSRELGRLMVARGRGGSMVNVSSIVGHRAYPNLAHYCCAKTALDSLTRVAAMELGVHGVRCNAVAPGLVRTGHSGAVVAEGQLDAVRETIPMGRFCTPEDVAEVTAYLVSDAAAFVNGQVIAVDGGELAGTFQALGSRK